MSRVGPFFKPWATRPMSARARAALVSLSTLSILGGCASTVPPTPSVETHIIIARPVRAVTPAPKDEGWRPIGEEDSAQGGSGDGRASLDEADDLPSAKTSHPLAARSREDGTRSLDEVDPSQTPHGTTRTDSSSERSLDQY